MKTNHSGLIFSDDLIENEELSESLLLTSLLLAEDIEVLLEEQDQSVPVYLSERSWSDFFTSSQHESTADKEQHHSIIDLGTVTTTTQVMPLLPSAIKNLPLNQIEATFLHSPAEPNPILTENSASLLNSAYPVLALDIGPYFAKGGAKGPPSGGGDEGSGGGTGGSKGGGKTKNTQPVVDTQSIDATEDGPSVSGQLTVTDPDLSDTHTFTLVSGPSEGNVTVSSDGSFTFDPSTDFQDLGIGQTRTVSFNVTATDSSGARNDSSAQTTINVTVSGRNDISVANDDVIDVEANQSTTISAMSGVLANDMDVDGDLLSASIVSGPVNGSLIFNANGSFEYTHSGNGSTSDTFTYQLFDGTAYSNVATVELNVVPVLQDPTGLKINLIDIGGAAPGTLAGDAFTVAASFWESLFLDPITINLQVGFSSLGAGILGSTSSAKQITDYASIRLAMTNDQTSNEDATAVSALQTGPLQFYTNDPLGNFYLDNNGSANNTYLNVNTANLKALGLINDVSQIDGTVQFSSNFNFDFDNSDGVSSGTFDFVSIAVHEIGHALGFVSGVDVIDYYSSSGPGTISSFDPYAIFSTLDLFRYSPDSLNWGTGILDLGIGDRNQYFSLDGGLNSITTFSTGVYNGDGRQASHWEDNLGIGIMDPTFSSGELGIITEEDILAFDIMGYDLVEGATTMPLDQILDINTLDSLSGLVVDGAVKRTYIYDEVGEIPVTVLSNQFQDDVFELPAAADDALI